MVLGNNPLATVWFIIMGTDPQIIICFMNMGSNNVLKPKQVFEPMYWINLIYAQHNFSYQIDISEKNPFFL